MFDTCLLSKRTEKGYRNDEGEGCGEGGGGGGVTAALLGTGAHLDVVAACPGLLLSVWFKFIN